MTKDWREMWEDAAAEDRAVLDGVPVDELLERVKSRNYDSYYNIWYSIAARSDLKQAGWVLYGALEKETGYLHRYHCAAALLSLLRNADFEPVQLSSDEHNCKANLRSISALLKKQIGTRKR